jgi:hypothetical protein
VTLSLKYEVLKMFNTVKRGLCGAANALLRMQDPVDRKVAPIEIIACFRNLEHRSGPNVQVSG